jgi:hypothetical protein
VESTLLLQKLSKYTGSFHQHVFLLLNTRYPPFAPKNGDNMLNVFSECAHCPDAYEASLRVCTRNNELTLESKKIVACFLQGVMGRVGLELHEHDVLDWHSWKVSMKKKEEKRKEKISLTFRLYVHDTSEQHTHPHPPHAHAPHSHMHSGPLVSCTSDQALCLLLLDEKKGLVSPSPRPKKK